MKFVRPLYRALYASTVGRRVALETFATHKHSYLSVVRKSVESDLRAAGEAGGGNPGQGPDALLSDRTAIFVSVIAILLFLINAAFIQQ